MIMNKTRWLLVGLVCLVLWPAHALLWYAARRKELQNHLLIRSQAFGEALDLDLLKRLARYEVHLDRKLERTSGQMARGRRDPAMESILPCP